MTTNTNTTTADRHAKRRHEAPELGKASQRFMRALVRRSAEGDTEALEALVALQAVLQEAITDAGRALHDDAGYSFTELAQVLGISRQGARQRFTTPGHIDRTACEAAGRHLYDLGAGGHSADYCRPELAEAARNHTVDEATTA